MLIEITTINNKTNYINGTVGEYRFEAKHYDERSKFGIDEGRTSKLTITKDYEEIINYDRGWDIKPSCREHIELLDSVVNHLEQLPKRFENEMELNI